MKCSCERYSLPKRTIARATRIAGLEKLRHAFDDGFFATLDSTVISAECLKETVWAGKLSPKYCKLNVLLHNEMAARDQFEM